LRIKVIAVGKLKENYLREAITHYSRGIKKHCQFQIIEVSDERAPEKYSSIEIERVRIKEGEKILHHVDVLSYVIALVIKGKKKTTEELQRDIEKINNLYNKEIIFIIGGSNGLSPEVLKRANDNLSFSPMTFPHQLMRVILLEQIEKVISGSNSLV
jgi:23S rRNA (pseudouridine1915-N3)-methyltransferase